jgi:hypothetical protein
MMRGFDLLCGAGRLGFNSPAMSKKKSAVKADFFLEKEQCFDTMHHF